MEKELKQHIKNLEFDLVSEKLEYLTANQPEVEDAVKKTIEQWKRFKLGISMGTYTLDQVKAYMVTEFLAVLRTIDFDSVELELLLFQNFDFQSQPAVNSKTDDSVELVYIGFWERVLIKLVDSMVFLVLFPLNNFALVQSFANRTIVPYTFFILFFIVFQVIMVVRFGGTVGKLLFNVRIVDENANYLKAGKALLRDLPGLLLIGLSLLTYSYVISRLDSKVEVDSYLQIIFLLGVYSGGFLIYFHLMNLLILVDAFAVAFMDKKRALHDVLAGSYVVSLKSLRSKNGGTS